MPALSGSLRVFVRLLLRLIRSDRGGIVWSAAGSKRLLRNRSLFRTCVWIAGLERRRTRATVNAVLSGMLCWKRSAIGRGGIISLPGGTARWSPAPRASGGPDPAVTQRKHKTGIVSARIPDRSSDTLLRPSHLMRAACASDKASVT